MYSHLQDFVGTHFQDSLITGDEIEVRPNNYYKQECIPVGCVPSATVAVCWGGVPAQGGYLVVGGVPDPGRGGVPVPGVCVPGPGGVPGPRGCTCPGAGVPAQAFPPPPVDRQTGVKT